MSPPEVSESLAKTPDPFVVPEIVPGKVMLGDVVVHTPSRNGPPTPTLSIACTLNVYVVAAFNEDKGAWKTVFATDTGAVQVPLPSTE
jgi:hypothetical protein